MAKHIRYYLSTTSDRVSKHTSSRINHHILRRMEVDLSRYINDRGAIANRLHELEYEWDIERVVEVSLGGAILSSLWMSVMGVKRSPWFAGLAGAILLSHGLQGWGPSVMLLRRMGFRTAREIESERAALKALRGDFDLTQEENISARHLLHAVDPSFYH